MSLFSRYQKNTAMFNWLLCSPYLGQTQLLPYRNSSIPQYHYLICMELTLSGLGGKGNIAPLTFEGLSTKNYESVIYNFLLFYYHFFSPLLNYSNFFFFHYSISFVSIRRPHPDCSHCERNQVTYYFKYLNEVCKAYIINHILYKKF